MWIPPVVFVILLVRLAHRPAAQRAGQHAGQHAQSVTVQVRYSAQSAAGFGSLGPAKALSAKRSYRG